jgi:pantetheine-phosphate adenylyltransferase
LAMSASSTSMPGIRINGRPAAMKNAQMPASAKRSPSLIRGAPVEPRTPDDNSAGELKPSIMTNSRSVKIQSLAPKPNSVIAIYPGSFDPITNGHLDLIARGARLADRLVVAILRNESKQPLFSIDERTDMLKQVLSGYENVEVESFDGLLVDYAQRRGAHLILRGIRAISDYEYELQMALMNRRLRPEIETVFLMSGEAYSFISSRLVKEIIRLGGNISGLVPPEVEDRLKQRFPGELK